MFAVCGVMFAALSVWYQLRWIKSPAGITMILLAGFAAAALEAVTPWGMESLSVPIGTPICIHLLSKLLIVPHFG
jgi:hypothetical protein